jgi:5-formyltetrahydrofolate cyclo-ligase
MTKEAIRRQATEQIRSLSPDDRIVMDAQATNAITGLAAWEAADAILGYVAMNDEVDIQGILAAALREGKRVGLPRMEAGSSRMVFLRVDADSGDLLGELETHRFGFLQPPARAPQLYPHPRDSTGPGNTMMIIPGRAFDRRGYRIGRGGGFYDRFLNVHGAGLITVGVGYTCQMFASVPRDERDVPLQMVVTDSEICLAHLF